VVTRIRKSDKVTPSDFCEYQSINDIGQALTYWQNSITHLASSIKKGYTSIGKENYHKLFIRKNSIFRIPDAGSAPFPARYFRSTTKSVSQLLNQCLVYYSQT
jgi:hypothetical protein